MTRTTLELLDYWRRDGRAAAAVLRPARGGRDDHLPDRGAAPTSCRASTSRATSRATTSKAEGYTAFRRYACKMATGSGKTTVMGMLAAWSILNKVNDRGDARFSDVVLVVCPNVTIRSRLRELDPERGEASLYRTRDLVPAAPDARPRRRGACWSRTGTSSSRRRSQAGGVSATRGQGRRAACAMPETITIGAEDDHGARHALPDAGGLRAAGGGRAARRCSTRNATSDGNLKKVARRAVRYVESDTALVNRMLGREVGGKQNILVMNDEAHHAYRIRRDEPDEDEDGPVRRGGRGRRVLQGGDGLDRRPRPHPQAARHQLLRRPVGDAVLPRARRAGHEPAVPVGRERLRADRRHRVGPGEDPAARRARHDRRGDSGLLQHLALDPAASSPPAERGGQDGRTRSPRRS